MKNKITRFLSAWFVLAVCFCGSSTQPSAIASSPGSSKKPMGAWFVNYEKFIVEDEFIWPTGAYIDSQWGNLDVAQLPKYSAVLLGQATGKRLSAQENDALEKWVAEGGTLIFTSDEPRRLWDNKPPAWVAGAGAVAHWQHDPIQPEVQQPDHPLLHNVPDLCVDTDPKGVRTPWKVEGGLGAFSVGQSIVGKGNVSILYENHHGKGRIIYADSHFIPNRWPATGVPPHEWTINLKPLEKQFWTNLMAYLDIPNRHDVIAEWAKQRSGKDALAVWFRDASQYALGARVHVPPCPLKGDEIKEMRLDMGIGELVRRDFFVTTPQEMTLTIEPTDLAGKHKHRIPASQIRLFIQEKPTPDYPKASYFLVDPRDVEPLDSPAVKLQANEAYTYWIMIESRDAAPGEYAGALRFRSGDRLIKSVPIRVKVWPLHQPGPEVLHFEMEHFWFGMPGGYWLDPKESNADVLKKYQDNLGRLSVDVGETWGDIERGYYNKFIHLRSDGRQIDQAIAESPELFLKDPMPSLSFASGPRDVWWNNAIQAGMSSFSESWSAAEIAQAFAWKAYKNDKLAIGSPEHLRFVKWFWGEYYKYLRERGLFKAYVKLGDEAGPEGIPDYIKTAAPVQAAGYKIYTTAYNMIQAKDSIVKLDPYMDMWQIGWPEEDFKVFCRKNDIPFDANNEVWGTAASSYWAEGYSYGRGFGLNAARLRMDGVHLHGYLRWQWIEVAGTYVGRDRKPCDSVEATNWGQGISDGRYLAQLYRMIDLAKKTGRGARVAAEIENQIEREVVGFPQASGPGPLFPLKADPDATIIGGAKIHMANPATQSFAASVAAKVKIFEMMLRLQAAMGTLAPNVVYDTIPLVTDGRAACQIVSGGEEKPARALAERIEKLGGAKPPVAAQVDKADATLVLIGTLQDNPALAAFVREELATEITPHYPIAGGYAILRLPATARRPAVLIVAGGDAAGVEIGVNNLNRLLTTENRW